MNTVVWLLIVAISACVSFLVTSALLSSLLSKTVARLQSRIAEARLEGYSEGWDHCRALLVPLATANEPVSIFTIHTAQEKDWERKRKSEEGF